MVEISIREAQQSEHHEIADICIQVWQQAYRGLIADEFLDNLSLERWLKGRIHWFAEPDRFSVVALHEEKIIGFADFGISRYAEHGKGEIYAINVLTDYQRYGAGKLLLRHAMQQLQQKKLMPYFVKTLENNLPAQTFYEAMGFHATDNLVSRIGKLDYKEIIYTCG